MSFDTSKPKWLFVLIGLAALGAFLFALRLRCPECFDPGRTNIDQGPDRVMISYQYENKIVYTTDQGADEAALRADCRRRGGVFDECGSICPAGTDVCADVCAFTCEFDPGARFNEKSMEPEPYTAQTARLVGIGDFGGEGIATRDYDGSAFVHTIAAKLPDPGPNRYYQAWLADPADPSESVSTGRLEKMGGGWSLTYSSQGDLTPYRQVIVSREKAERQWPVMDGKILIGTFRE